MATQREQKRLMRERGAGARQLQDDDFVIALPGASIHATAGTAAQRAKQTARTSAAASSLIGRRRGSTEAAAHRGETQVDGDGSAAKKRKIAAASESFSAWTPATNAQQQPIARVSQKSSSGKKRKKRKSISQGSLFKKRSSANQVPAGHRTIETAGIDADQDEDRNAEDAGLNLDTQDEGQIVLAATAEKIVPLPESQLIRNEIKEPWQPRKKARKSTGGPVKFRGFSAALPARETTVRVSDEQNLEPDFLPDNDDSQEQPVPEPVSEFEMAEDPAVVSESRDDQDLPAAATEVQAKRKRKKRKSVNPIQQERKQKRLSLEAARDSQEPTITIPQQVKPSSRKLASQQAQPASAANRTSRTSRPTSKVLQPRIGGRVSKSTAKSVQAKPGSVAITMFRLQTDRELPVIEEESEEETQPAQTKKVHPNAIDAVAQVCGEIVQHSVDVAKGVEKKASGRSERATVKRQRVAMQAFGNELDARFMSMTQAIDGRARVETQLREARGNKKRLREELIGSREEQDELATETVRLKRKRDLAERVSAEDGKIVTLYKKIGRSIRDARKEQGSSTSNAPEGLEYGLRNTANYRTAEGRKGIIGKIKALRSNLERIAW